MREPRSGDRYNDITSREAARKKNLWPQLFKGWIMLSTGKITIRWINGNKTNQAIRWIAI